MEFTSDVAIVVTVVAVAILAKIGIFGYIFVRKMRTPVNSSVVATERGAVPATAGQ
jgi:uncharacterized membrane protein AbrB (regulator of aidB expression)